MSRKPPPPKPKHRGSVEAVYRASYAYQAQRPDELSFDEGDILYVLEKGADGWWKAKVGGKEGFIPHNYVSESAETIDNPMHEAAKRANFQFVKECISNSVSVNGLDKAGSTPLHWAAQCGSEEIVSLLLGQSGIQINVQNKLGDTPMHAAAWKGHPGALKLLLDAGATKTLKNQEKKTPLMLARNPECAALLQDAPKVSSLLAADDDDSD
ncbi:osteoclast-stimulating factor 1-like [Sycon ciliatum]|uniref:osteoclast-stimulating factor 1-like n=1 Tax=Sycon ciliatum TaxID=27933 RepID=UPI0020ABF90C|eukprot:scpid85467/ scgid14629/ Osteoclast-stimulating factor 1